MWSTTAPTMNTCTARAWNSRRRLLPLLATLALAACTQDTASYAIGGDRQHAILLIRNQAWFWDDRIELTIAPAHLPECQGSLIVKDVPKNASIQLHQAPDEYAEPIYILKTGERAFAVSTTSCRVQAFKQAPAEPGVLLGTFSEGKEGFAFRPADGKAAK